MDEVDTQVLNMKEMLDQLKDREKQAVADFHLMTDAMELLIKLWPSPSHATVTLETHDWQRLRPILSSMSRLWVEAYR